MDFARPLKGTSIDSAGVASSEQQAFVNGNSSLYLDTLADMARQKGMTVVSRFNLHYDTWLPAAQGHVLLIETHDGIPAMPLSVLDQFYPGASGGLKTPDGIVSVGNTKIVFVDFSRLLSIPLDRPNFTSTGIDFRCEADASTSALLELKETAHNTVLRTWQVQVPATFTLKPDELTPDSYNLYVSANGYASQVINVAPRTPRSRPVLQT